MSNQLFNQAVNQLKLLLLSRGESLQNYNFVSSSSTLSNSNHKVIVLVNISNFSEEDIIVGSTRWRAVKTQLLNQAILNRQLSDSDDCHHCPVQSSQQTFQLNALSAVSEPTEFLWTEKFDSNSNKFYEGTMEVGVHTFDFGSNGNLTTRAFRQAGGNYSIPGPTLRMDPGNRYIVILKNLLPYEDVDPTPNVFKNPNIINIHTHGLHISGESPGDDVTRHLQGDRCFSYMYDIPADHMGGTFWYHSHNHGSTFLQVAAGMFGMIIINENPQTNIPVSVIGNGTTTFGMKEKILAVGYLDPGVAGTGGDNIVSGTLSPTWTVNGQINGDIDISNKNEWYRFRILLADRDAKMKAVSFGVNAEVVLLARDGVWRRSVPKVLSNGSINLTGASRADFAVRFTGNSSLLVGGSTVANILVGATSGNPLVSPYNLSVGPTATWMSGRPSYLRDLRGVNNALIESRSVNMGARTVNGSKFDHDVPTFTIDSNMVQRWNVKGALNHPFHLHIYHVQMDGGNTNFEDGEYYDVVAANGNVLFDLNPATSKVFAGRTIMHCHILEHEDQGAMGWANITGVGATPAPVFPPGTNYSKTPQICVQVNNTPVVTITSPTDGSEFNLNDVVNFIGAANDVEDGNISSDIMWTSSLQGLLGMGASINTSLTVVGTHHIMAMATDSNGAQGSSSVSVTVIDPNANNPPVVTITSPTDGSMYSNGPANVTFNGTATDNEDGNLSALIQWSSSINGPFGTGASVTFLMSVGTHLITASVTDSGAPNNNPLTSSNTVTITVNPPSSSITLNVNGYKVRGEHTVDLTWTGATGANVDVYRDLVKIATVPNNGAYTDNTGNKGSGVTYMYRVCEVGSTLVCSNIVSVTF